jgi:hypothetical protein
MLVCFLAGCWWGWHRRCPAALPPAAHPQAPPHLHPQAPPRLLLLAPRCHPTWSLTVALAHVHAGSRISKAVPAGAISVTVCRGTSDIPASSAQVVTHATSDTLRQHRTSCEDDANVWLFLVHVLANKLPPGRIAIEARSCHPPLPRVTANGTGPKRQALVCVLWR